MIGTFSSRYTGYFSYYSPLGILEYHFDEIMRKSGGVYV